MADIDTASSHSPLQDRHEALGAKFADFGGWSMPLEYPTGVVKEHTAVRERAGLFDVSHLGKVWVTGSGAAHWLNSCLTNDLGRIAPGKAQYTLCCDPTTGGIVDDLIVYYHADDRLLLVPNAANTAEVVRRLHETVPAGVALDDVHHDYAIVAVQGPRSGDVLQALDLPSGHDYMSFIETEYDGHSVVVCRTGYTGERGYELIADNRVAGSLFDALMTAGQEYGMTPAGLAARDTLRTEMGYPLHGQDITIDVTPNQARLGWAVGWDKPAFWGQEVLAAERAEKPTRLLRGLVALGRGIPRPGMSVSLLRDVPLCEITSGTFSPTLRKGIGLALVPTLVNPEAELGVDIRGRREIFQLVTPPFVDTSVRD